MDSIQFETGQWFDKDFHAVIGSEAAIKTGLKINDTLLFQVMVSKPKMSMNINTMNISSKFANLKTYRNDYRSTHPHLYFFLLGFAPRRVGAKTILHITTDQLCLTNLDLINTGR
ncbi:MAG: hypothetical protein IPM92_12775 [Saprospiraceae bacterium]|nr:hypothetical protein [Saprospiraceae bacterium]